MLSTVQTFVLTVLGTIFLIGVKECHGLFEEQILVYTDSFNKNLRGVSARTGTSYRVDIERLSNPIAIHYNELDERIYWSDVLLKEIRSTSLDGHDDVTIKELNTSSIPDGIAVDPISELLFYTDAGNHLIGLMDLSGHNHAVVVNTDCDQPRAIVVDPMSGRMYWSDWGKVPKIESAYYDGSDRDELVTIQLLWPNALTIDFTGNWMYWGDAGTHYIERARLDGSNRQIVYYEPTAHYFSMIIQSDRLYYTDWTYKTVMSLNISRIENSTAVGTDTTGTVARLNGLTRLKAKPTYPRTNACSKNKGGCSHICLPRPKGKHVCICPLGYKLVGKTNCKQETSWSSNTYPSSSGKYPLSSGKSPSPSGKTPSSSGKSTVSGTRVKEEVKITCPILVPGEFMSIFPMTCSTQSATVGTVCTVQCKEGFVYLDGQQDLVCTEDGVWSATVKQCIDVTKPVIHNCPDDGTVLTSKGGETAILYWSIVYATDNSGIVPNYFETVVSGTKFHEGKHNVIIFAVDHAGNFAFCHFTYVVKVRRCGAVSVPERGYIASGWCPDYYGAECKIACNTGYQFQTDGSVASIECVIGSNGTAQWSGHSLRCEPIACPPEILAPNAILSGCSSPYAVGTVCEQTCAEGFEKVQGTDVRICKLDGSWSGNDIRCKIKTVMCPQLPYIPTSRVEGCTSPFTVGTVCEQVCIAGYQMEGLGSGIRVCKSDGTWSGNDAACTKVHISSSVFQSHDGVPQSDYIFTRDSVIVVAMVTVIMLMVVNVGIFVNLRNIGTNARISTSRTHTEQNDGEVDADTSR